jgi:hypothetical protein
MQHQETFRVLADCDEGYLGICACCRKFTFAYKNLMLSFHEDEMHQFLDWLISSSKSREHYVQLPHGRNRVFAGPHSNLFFSFNDHELEEIESLYHQALLLLQVDDLLLVNRRH